MLAFLKSLWWQAPDADRFSQSFAVHGSKTELGVSQISLYVLFKSLSKTLHDTHDKHTEEHALLAELAISDACDSEILSAKSFLARLDGTTNHRHDGTLDGNLDESLESHPKGLTRPHAKDNYQTSPSKPFASRIIPFLRRRAHSKVTPEPLNRDFETRPQQRPIGLSGIIGRKAQLIGNKKLFNKPPRPPSQPLPSPPPSSHASSDHDQESTRLSSHKAHDIASIRPASSNLSNQFSNYNAPQQQSPASHHDAHVKGHAILVSVYEVHNDRIYDLLRARERRASPSISTESKKPSVHFKYTKNSGKNKVVAGLVKVACATYEEAIVVLESGLAMRGTNDVKGNQDTPKNHVFVCIDVKRKMVDRRNRWQRWEGSSLTIVDIAGEQRRHL